MLRVDMKPSISYDRSEETPEAKARWFQSLSLEERMDMLCAFTDLILTVNPRIVEAKDAQQAVDDLITIKRASGREVDLSDVRLLEISKKKND